MSCRTARKMLNKCVRYTGRSYELIDYSVHVSPLSSDDDESLVIRQPWINSHPKNAKEAWDLNLVINDWRWWRRESDRINKTSARVSDPLLLKVSDVGCAFEGVEEEKGASCNQHAGAGAEHP